MKTLTKTLMATGLGLFGSLNTMEAAQTWENVPAGIAVGGCYETASPNWCGTNGYRDDVNYDPRLNNGDSTYDVGARSRFTYDNEGFHTLPFPANDPGHASQRPDHICGYVAQNRRPSPSFADSYHNRYEARFGKGFDDSYDSRYEYRNENLNAPMPRFEPWRPMNASYRSDHRNW